MGMNQREWTDAERQEVFAEALHHPDTAEERAIQQAKFHSWLNDPRYEHLWPMLERLIESPMF
jgi:hypothetical protein